jgi:hypothetical protein
MARAARAIRTRTWTPAPPTEDNFPKVGRSITLWNSPDDWASGSSHCPVVHPSKTRRGRRGPMNLNSAVAAESTRWRSRLRGAKITLAATKNEHHDHGIQEGPSGFVLPWNLAFGIWTFFPRRSFRRCVDDSLLFVDGENTAPDQLVQDIVLFGLGEVVAEVAVDAAKEADFLLGPRGRVGL